MFYSFNFTVYFSLKEIQPKKRNIAVGTSIITRDVAVSHKLPLTSSCGVMTDFYEPPTLPVTSSNTIETETSLVSSSVQTDKYYEISLSHKSIQTNLKFDTVYSSEDLERNIDKAIKLYEKTYYHLLHPRKPSCIDNSVQVDTKSAICRDYGVQARCKTFTCGTLFKPEFRNCGVQTLSHHVYTRDIGVSDDTVLNSCSQCTVKKYSVGTLTQPDKKLKLFSLGGRSTTFDQIDLNKKYSKSVAVGPDKSVSSSKSTDTGELNTKKDVAINTTKNKLVDAALDPINKPHMLHRRQGSFSKIPRPVKPARCSRSLSRQDTYLVSPSPTRKR